MAETRGANGLQVFPKTDPDFVPESRNGQVIRPASDPIRNPQPDPLSAPESEKSPADRPGHSPGPWVWGWETGNVIQVYRVTGGIQNEEIAEVWLDSEHAAPDRTEAGMEADARLISVAPQLLESLLAVEWAGSDSDEDDDLIDVCPNCGATFGDPEKGLTGLHTPGCELRDALDAALGVTSPRRPLESPA